MQGELYKNIAVTGRSASLLPNCLACQASVANDHGQSWGADWSQSVACQVRLLELMATQEGTRGEMGEGHLEHSEVPTARAAKQARPLGVSAFKILGDSK